MYLSNLGIFYDFVYKQYELKQEDLTIKVEEGETFIVGGGCFGNNALYFSFLRGQKGGVYSFEFIPGNIDLFNNNTSINPSMRENIAFATSSLWDKSHVDVFFIEKRPGSIIGFKNDFDYDGIVKTISIDDYIDSNGIKKIGFIKLDIE